MKRKVPILKIDRWEEQEVDEATCVHPYITRFIGACDHVAYRCLTCDVRLDITPHVYTDRQ